jgi:hypothetical protein
MTKTADEKREELRDLAFKRAQPLLPEFDFSVTAQTFRAARDAWLATKPHLLVLFCEAMQPILALCQAGRFDEARAQLRQNFFTNQNPPCRPFVDAMPEILLVMDDAMNDDEELTRVVRMLADLLPRQS